jgi:hypothetical protein
MKEYGGILSLFVVRVDWGIDISVFEVKSYRCHLYWNWDLEEQLQETKES